MAGEIFQSHIVSDVLYALVTRPSDKYIWNFSGGTPAFEAVGTWNDARVIACAVPMTAIGDMHYADFPVTDTDILTYQVQVRVSAGGLGAEAIADWIKSQGEISWNGESAEEITLVTIESGFTTVNQEVPLPEHVETRARIYI